MFIHFSHAPLSHAADFGRWLLLVSLMFVSGLVNADTATELNEKYEEIEESLFENAYGIPIFLKSDGEKDLMQGEVYGVIYHPFRMLS